MVLYRNSESEFLAKIARLYLTCTFQFTWIIRNFSKKKKKRKMEIFKDYVNNMEKYERNWL